MINWDKCLVDTWSCDWWSALPKGDPLPKPDVTVTPATDRDTSAPVNSQDVVISRNGRAMSVRTSGGNTTDVVKDAVEKILADTRSAEYVK